MYIIFIYRKGENLINKTNRKSKTFHSSLEYNFNLLGIKLS